MPSFDIVNEMNWQELDNALQQTLKELSTRFDFKGSKATVVFDKTAKTLTLSAEDDLKLRALQQMLELKMVKRGLDLRCLSMGKIDTGSMGHLRQVVTVKNGIEKEEAKKLLAFIKEQKLKIQAQIQDEQVRVSGKSIDDLQSAIQAIKAGAPVALPLQFINMRS